LHVRAVALQERTAGRELSVTPLPIFSAATRATSFVLANFLTLLQVPGWLLRHRRTLLGALCGALLLSALYAIRT
jgi:hypothetical protein